MVLVNNYYTKGTGGILPAETSMETSNAVR